MELSHALHRLVVADDSPLLREGITRLLTEAGFELVAQAGNPTDLLMAVSEHRPDVAIIDIRMPPTHTDEGLRAAEAIRAEHGTTVGILVLSQDFSKLELPPAADDHRRVLAVLAHLRG